MNYIFYEMLSQFAYIAHGPQMLHEIPDIVEK